MKLLFILFASFVRVGAMTFGGGYAMLPMLEREVVEKRRWASSEEIMDYFAVGQCTPGVIAVNTATFVGYSQAGVPGGIAATLGVITPSLAIITLIAALLTGFADQPWVKSAFAGVRVCVCVLIFNAVIKLWKGAVKDKAALVLCLGVFVLSLWLDLSPVVFVLFCAAAGIVLNSLGVRGK